MNTDRKYIFTEKNTERNIKMKVEKDEIQRPGEKDKMNLV